MSALPLRRASRAGTLIGLGLALLAPSAAALRPVAVADDRVRPPAVAGRFYPGDPARLRRAVETLARQARPAPADDVVAVIAPHAGYVYSGQIAADAFASLQRHPPDVVVVLGANHTTERARGFALHPGQAFGTPLGEIAIDTTLTAALLDAEAGATLDAAPHRAEHSIEVLLPFVQVLAPRARIVPVVVGTQDAGRTARFGRALAAALGTRRALVVASSDLSHYPSARDAARLDAGTLEALARFDAEAAVEAERGAAAGRTPGLVTAACGLGPVLVAMSAARALGASHATVVSYSNSGDSAAGDPDRVVGYGAVAYHRDAATPPAPTPDAPPAGDRGALSPDERRALLGLARATVTQFLDSQTLPLPRDLPGGLAARRQGAFVTLKDRDRLRGCIGRVEHDGALPQLVSRVAFEAAFRDPRFSPLSRDELARVEVEVSLLSPPRRAPSPASVVVGRDGVVLRKSGRSAVFLPQVATEQGWTREQLLDALCEKAGLAAGCWPGAELSTFQAEVFSERDKR